MMHVFVMILFDSHNIMESEISRPIVVVSGFISVGIARSEDCRRSAVRMAQRSKIVASNHEFAPTTTQRQVVEVSSEKTASDINKRRMGMIVIVGVSGNEILTTSLSQIGSVFSTSHEHASQVRHVEAVECRIWICNC